MNHGSAHLTSRLEGGVGPSGPSEVFKAAHPREILSFLRHCKETHSAAIRAVQGGMPESTKAGYGDPALHVSVRRCAPAEGQKNGRGA